MIHQSKRSWIRTCVCRLVCAQFATASSLTSTPWCNDSNSCEHLRNKVIDTIERPSRKSSAPRTGRTKRNRLAKLREVERYQGRVANISQITRSSLGINQLRRISSLEMCCDSRMTSVYWVANGERQTWIVSSKNSHRLGPEEVNAQDRTLTQRIRMLGYWFSNVQLGLRASIIWRVVRSSDFTSFDSLGR